eukprot:1160720-Pelagomonas_calceolata.AAC.4
MSACCCHFNSQLHLPEHLQHKGQTLDRIKPRANPRKAPWTRSRLCVWTLLPWTSLLAALCSRASVIHVASAEEPAGLASLQNLTCRMLGLLAKPGGASGLLAKPDLQDAWPPCKIPDLQDAWLQKCLLGTLKPTRRLQAY